MIEKLGKKDDKRDGGHYDSSKEIAKVRSMIRGYYNGLQSSNSFSTKTVFLRKIANQLMMSTPSDEVRGEINKIEKEIDTSSDLDNIQQKLHEIEGKIFTQN